jgi:thiamine-monophosphate kinase
MREVGAWDEFGFIAELLVPLTDDTGLGLADDAACYDPPSGQELIITTDALVSGVHFPENADGGLVARRALACNISDLAAKGAKPVGCLMSLGVGPHWDEDWLRAFVASLGQGLSRWGLALWGGDTVGAPTPFISLTLHGLVPQGQMIRRDGAQKGDDVYVTGTIGDGYLGLKDEGAAYSDPNPPLAFGQGLVGLASAALDVSDGLIADLHHICSAAHCAMQIDAAHVPLSAAGRAYIGDAADNERLNEHLADLLSGGDDLQIAFTAAPDKHEAVQAVARDTGTDVHKIGTVTAATKGENNITLRDGQGAIMVLERAGYRHF